MGNRKLRALFGMDSPEVKRAKEQAKRHVEQHLAAYQQRVVTIGKLLNQSDFTPLRQIYETAMEHWNQDAYIQAENTFQLFTQTADTLEYRATQEKGAWDDNLATYGVWRDWANKLVGTCNSNSRTDLGARAKVELDELNRLINDIGVRKDWANSTRLANAACRRVEAIKTEWDDFERDKQLWESRASELVPLKRDIDELARLQAEEAPELVQGFTSLQQNLNAYFFPHAIGWLNWLTDRAGAAMPLYPAKAEWRGLQPEVSKLEMDLKKLAAWKAPGVEQLSHDLDKAKQQAAEEKFSLAVSAFKFLQSKVATALQQGTAIQEWDYLTEVHAVVQKKVENLTQANDPRAGELQVALEQLNHDISGGDFAKAKEGLERLVPKVDDAHANLDRQAAWPQLEPIYKEIQQGITQLDKNNDPDAPALAFELKSLDKQVDRGQYPSSDDLIKFRLRVRKLLGEYPARQEWADLDAVYTEMLMKLKTLGAWKDPAQPLLFKRLEMVYAKSNQRDYATASSLLRALQPDVRQAHDERVALRAYEAAKKEHDKAMETLDLKLSLTDDVPSTGMAPPVSDLKSAVDELRREITLADNDKDYPKLPKLRTALDQKASELLNAFTPTKSKDAFFFKFDRDSLAYQRLAQQTNVVVPLTPTIRGMKEKWEQETQAWIELLGTSRSETTAWKAIRQQLDALTIQANAILEADATAGETARAVQAGFAKLKPKIDLATDLDVSTDETLVPLEANFSEALRAYQNEWNAGNLDNCQDTLLPALSQAIEDLFLPRTQQVAELYDVVTNPDQAGALVEFAYEHDLRALPPDKQIGLLKQLRGKKDFDRKLQRKLYNAMEIDPAFEEDDTKKREQLVKALAENREFAEAKKNWETMTPDKKKAVLETLAKEQCAIFGFEGPPPIKLVDLGGDTQDMSAAYFDSNTKCIVININAHSPFHTDFEETIDTIAHENSHNYQDQLISGMLSLSDDDPRKVQVELFRSNDGAIAYVDPGESHADYKKQPLEEHAHRVGPAVAKGLIRELNRID